MCLLLFGALADLSGLAIFNLLSQSAGDFEFILLLLLVFLTLQMPLIGGHSRTVMMESFVLAVYWNETKDCRECH